MGGDVAGSGADADGRRVRRSRDGNNSSGCSTLLARSFSVGSSNSFGSLTSSSLCISGRGNLCFSGRGNDLTASQSDGPCRFRAGPAERGGGKASPLACSPPLTRSPASTAAVQVSTKNDRVRHSLEPSPKPPTDRMMIVEFGGEERGARSERRENRGEGGHRHMIDRSVSSSPPPPPPASPPTSRITMVDKESDHNKQSLASSLSEKRNGIGRSMLRASSSPSPPPPPKVHACSIFLQFSFAFVFFIRNLNRVILQRIPFPSFSSAFPFLSLYVNLLFSSPFPSQNVPISPSNLFSLPLSLSHTQTSGERTFEFVPISHTSASSSSMDLVVPNPPQQTEATPATGIFITGPEPSTEKPKGGSSLALSKSLSLPLPYSENVDDSTVGQRGEGHVESRENQARDKDTRGSEMGGGGKDERETGKHRGLSRTDSDAALGSMNRQAIAPLRRLPTSDGWSPALPTINGQHPDLRSISPETAADVLSGKFSHAFDRVIVFDCRFPFEYEGGHLKGAINSIDPRAVDAMLFLATGLWRPSLPLAEMYRITQTTHGPGRGRCSRARARGLCFGSGMDDDEERGVDGGVLRRGA